jgi:phage shock protein B
MSSVATLAVILLLTIVAPLFLVLHFVTKWKQTREISGDDEQLLEDLHELSQRLEDRLITLEKILGDEIPEGRKEL